MKRIGKGLPSETNRKQAIKLRLASGPVPNENTVPWWLEPVLFNGLIRGVLEGSESNTNKEEMRPKLRTAHATTGSEEMLQHLQAGPWATGHLSYTLASLELGSSWGEEAGARTVRRRTETGSNIGHN